MLRARVYGMRASNINIKCQNKQNPIKWKLSARPTHGLFLGLSRPTYSIIWQTIKQCFRFGCALNLLFLAATLPLFFYSHWMTFKNEMDVFGGLRMIEKKNMNFLFLFHLLLMTQWLELFTSKDDFTFFFVQVPIHFEMENKNQVESGWR